MSFSNRNYVNREHIDGISHKSEQLRGTSDQVRLMTTRTAESIRVSRNVNESQSNFQLDRRIEELEARCTQLNQLLDRINLLNERVEQQKDKANEFLNDLNYPFEVALQTRNVREFLAPHDAVVQSLIQEEACIEQNKQNLNQALTKIRLALNQLLECRHLASTDLDRKRIALEVDKQQRDRTKHSSNLSYKPNPLRMAKNGFEDGSWVETFNTLVNTIRSKLEYVEMIERALRDAIVDGKRNIEFRQQETDQALRNNMHQLQNSLGEIKWQIQKLNDEISDITTAINEREICFQEGRQPGKLVETRLESRQFRRPLIGERVEDHAQNTLRNEWGKHQEYQTNLDNDIRKLRLTLHDLEIQNDKLIEERNKVERYIEMERKCIDVRQKLQNQPHVSKRYVVEQMDFIK